MKSNDISLFQKVYRSLLERMSQFSWFRFNVRFICSDPCFISAFWDLSASKPKGLLCVSRESLISHFSRDFFQNQRIPKGELDSQEMNCPQEENNLLKQRISLYSRYIQSLSRCVFWKARGGKSGSSFSKSLGLCDLIRYTYHEVAWKLVSLLGQTYFLSLGQRLLLPYFFCETNRFLTSPKLRIQNISCLKIKN